VIVTTPQAAATRVALKGALMFQKVNVPLLGIAENMSHFIDPSGQKHMLFGSGGGIATAERLGTALLGQVPLVQGIREGGDKGVPIVVGDPESPAAGVFRAIAEALLATLEKTGPRPM
jgi:ATP-binding protein involved in chromosome partitioning